jgi:zinc protease
MLNRRLSRLAAQPEAPFEGASVSIYDHFSTARLAQVEVRANDRDWSGALAGGALELRRAVESGFTQAEFDEQLAVSRHGLTQASAPRTTPALADAILDAASRGIVFTAPAGSAANVAYLARIRLADVNRAFAAAWSKRDRLIFLSHNRRIPNEKTAIAGAVMAQFPY